MPGGASLAAGSPPVGYFNTEAPQMPDAPAVTPVPGGAQLSPTERPTAPSTPRPTLRRAPTPSFTPSEVTPIDDALLVEELRGTEVRTFTWRTNFNLRSVTYAEIIAGGPGKDGIPALHFPLFETLSHAEQWLSGRSPVQYVELNGDARAYPLMILTWHEIVNDVVGRCPSSSPSARCATPP